MSIAHSFENSPAIEYWAWSEHAKVLLEDSFPRMKIEMVGCPFLYLLKAIQYQPPETRVGSIVFPCHSTDEIKAELDVWQFVRDLQALPDKFHPIKVCIHHKDMGRADWIQAFSQAGFAVCTNGPVSQQFLYRFVENVNSCKYALSNQVTSGLLFAVAMGLTSALYGPEFQLTIKRENELYDKNYIQNMRDWEESVRDILCIENADVVRQRQLMEEILGTKYLLSPEEMRTRLWSLTLSSRCAIAAIHQVCRRLGDTSCKWFVGAR